jgi:hypothetical protein
VIAISMLCETWDQKRRASFCARFGSFLWYIWGWLIETEVFDVQQPFRFLGFGFTRYFK